MSTFYPIAAAVSSRAPRTVGNTTNLIEPSRVARIAVNLEPEVREHPQLGVVGGQVDVEVFHVVQRAVPPGGGPVGGVVCVGDDGRLAILRAGRPVEVEAVEPGAGAVQHFAWVLLVLGLRDVGTVEV